MFMTGFYSKDLILESAYGQFTFSGTVVYCIATIGAMFTTLYSVKVLYLTFLTNPNGAWVNYYPHKQHSKNAYSLKGREVVIHPISAKLRSDISYWKRKHKAKLKLNNKLKEQFEEYLEFNNSLATRLVKMDMVAKDKEVRLAKMYKVAKDKEVRLALTSSEAREAREGDIFMTLPLIILAVFSIFFGYITKDIFIGLGSGFFADNSIFKHPRHEIMINTEFAVPTLFKLLPLMFTISLSIIAIVVSEFALFQRILIRFKLSRPGYNIFSFFNQRFLIEMFYNKYITNFILKLGGQTTKVLDKGSVEYLGPFGLEKSLPSLSEDIASLNKGVITSYALYILIGLIVYILIPYFSSIDNTFFLLLLLCLLSLSSHNNNSLDSAEGHDFVSLPLKSEPTLVLVTAITAVMVNPTKVATATGMAKPGILVPGIPKPPALPENIEDILIGISTGVLELSPWLCLLLWTYYYGYKNRKLLAVHIDIRFRSVSIIDDIGQILLGWCIYDFNDRSAYWLSLLYWGSDFYYTNIIFNGVPTTCLVFRNSFNNNPLSELYDSSLYDFGLSAKLCVPHPNYYVWSSMLLAGCTIKTKGYPLLADIRRFNGQTIIVVWIHGDRPDLTWTVAI